MIEARIGEPLFSPQADQDMLDLGEKVVAIERSSGGRRLVALTNVTKEDVELGGGKLAKKLGKDKARDLITGREVKLEGLKLGGYEVLWLKA